MGGTGDRKMCTEPETEDIERHEQQGVSDGMISWDDAVGRLAESIPVVNPDNELSDWRCRYEWAESGFRQVGVPRGADVSEEQILAAKEAIRHERQIGKYSRQLDELADQMYGLEETRRRLEKETLWAGLKYLEAVIAKYHPEAVGMVLLFGGEDDSFGLAWYVDGQPDVPVGDDDFVAEMNEIYEMPVEDFSHDPDIWNSFRADTIELVGREVRSGHFNLPLAVPMYSSWLDVDVPR